jgi:PKD repeat protein
VIPDPEPAASILSPNSSEITLYEGESFNFEGVVTGGNEPFDFLWDFGDSGVSSVSEIKAEDIIFQKAGDYDVTFTVKEKNDTSDNDSVTIRVKIISDPKPVASIVSPDSLEIVIGVEESVRFTGDVEGGDEPFIYSWDFGDSGVAGINEIDAGDISLPKAGDYIVTFTVAEKNTPEDTDGISVKITVSPRPDLSPISSSEDVGNTGCFITVAAQ